MSPAQDLNLYQERSAGWWSEADRTLRSLRQIQRQRLELIRSWIPNLSTLSIVEACSLVVRAEQGESIKLWPTIRHLSIQLTWLEQKSISYCVLLQKA